MNAWDSPPQLNLKLSPSEHWAIAESLRNEVGDGDCNREVEVYYQAHHEFRNYLDDLDYAAGFAFVSVFAKQHVPELIRLPYGSHHKQFFDAIPRGERGLKINILAPRSSSKSTSMAELYPLHCIYYKELYDALGMFSEKYILILSRSLGNALDRTKSIKSYIESSESLQHLKGDEAWGEMRSITSNGVLLVPQSRGGKVRGSLFRGYRPSLILPDDLDDVESIRNPNTLQKDEEWFDTDLLECGDNYTNFVCIDTVKGEKAIANQLRYRPAWQNIFVQAIPNPEGLAHPDAEHLWQDYRKIYANTALEPQERSKEMEAFYTRHHGEMNADVIETWPDKWTYRQLREKEFDQGRAAVLREYQNHPVDMAMAIFDMENAVRFSVESEGLLRNDDRLVSWSQLSGGTIFLDWAGIKESLDNCYAAVVTILWEPAYVSNYTDVQGPTAFGYVYDVWLERGSRGKQIGALCDAYRKAHNFLSLRRGQFDLNLYCEDFIDTTGDIKENFLRHYESVRLSREISKPLQFLQRNRDKHERIAGLESPIGNGWLAFNTDLPKLFMDQMRQFPVADFNDGPDACEGAWECKIEETVGQREARQERARQRVADSKVIRL